MTEGFTGAASTSQFSVASPLGDSFDVWYRRRAGRNTDGIDHRNGHSTQTHTHPSPLPNPQSSFLSQNPLISITILSEFLD